MRIHKILAHLLLLCAQRGKKLGFSWRVESSSNKSKAHSWLHNAYQFKVLLHLPPFGRNINAKWCPSHYALLQFDPSLGVRVDHRPSGSKWYHSKCRPHIPIPLLYTLSTITHNLPPFGHNRQHTDRQTDRAIGKDCLYYSTACPKIAADILRVIDGHLVSTRGQFVCRNAMPGHVLRTFMQYSVTFCGRAEVASGVTGPYSAWPV